jgi:DNA-binding MarR family transcriptional regulator
VADEHDGRVKRVTLTKAGVKKLNETMRLWRKAQDRFESLFGEKRAAGLRAVLAELSSAEFRQAFKERDRQG